MHDGYGLTGGGLLLVFLVLLLLFGAIAALVVWAVTASQSRPGVTPSGVTPSGVTPSGATPSGVAPAAPFLPPARQILDERLARGEIDEDEYRRRRSALEGGG